MPSIAAALGAGSGIDTGRLVADLAAASREPKIAALDTRSNAHKAKISALAQARSDLESFATSFAGLGRCRASLRYRTLRCSAQSPGLVRALAHSLPRLRLRSWRERKASIRAMCRPPPILSGKVA
jgi:Flagellar hook-associated protein 2 N-terminus